eukprot:m.113915 g.113915  ORF g.113915 m.113915 type:complete len:60 (+) comp37470_c0_seq1:324-503(+)
MASRCIFFIFALVCNLWSHSGPSFFGVGKMPVRKTSNPIPDVVCRLSASSCAKVALCLC